MDSMLLVAAFYNKNVFCVEKQKICGNGTSLQDADHRLFAFCKRNF